MSLKLHVSSFNTQHLTVTNIFHMEKNQWQRRLWRLRTLLRFNCGLLTGLLSANTLPSDTCSSAARFTIAKEFEGQRARGDNHHLRLCEQAHRIPTDGTLTGNEEALDLGSFSMSMGTTRIGVKNPNSDTIEQQHAG